MTLGLQRFGVIGTRVTAARLATTLGGMRDERSDDGRFAHVVARRGVADRAEAFDRISETRFIAFDTDARVHHVA